MKQIHEKTMKIVYLLTHHVHKIFPQVHVVSQRRMSDTRPTYIWGLGSKAKQIVINVFNYFSRDPAVDTKASMQKTVDATGVGLRTVSACTVDPL